jgi:non-ribosomal peptide synthetase component E (peptide arylation enzyme)
MIVGGWAQGGERTTLDDLFRRAAVANPDAVALTDARRDLNYAEADRVIWTIASRLRALELPTDAVIGIQLPNTIESALTILGILRAGMVAALLPMLWRESEIVAALSTVGAKALVTSTQIGGTDHAVLAMRVAAALFSIRHVCAFGETLPDGVVALDNVFTARADTSALAARDGNPAAHAAIVTFEPTPRGIQPVPRNHTHLIAGGIPVAKASELNSANTLLSPMPLSSFAALATIIVPWLLSGARLILHQPFDVDAFTAQADGADVIALPVALAPAFASVNRTVIATWRAPERTDPDPIPGKIVDAVFFGEFGVHCGRRDKQGRVPLMLGTNHLPGHSPDRPNILEAKRTAAGTLSLRGGSVAKSGFATVDQSTAPVSDGFVDTGYPCRIDPEGSVNITGPQPGMVTAGGYRIASHDLDQVAAMMPFGVVSALPHALLGQRLAGASPKQSEVQAELKGRGLNALIVGAFSHRDVA